MKRSTLNTVAMILASVVSLTARAADEVRPNPSRAQQVLDRSAADQKYTFLVFYKEDNPAARTMAKAVQEELAKRTDEATVTFVQITNPDDKSIVDRFDVSRAPMPLTMAIAPNGAITGIFPQKATKELIANAFVTPTMTRTMKSLQQGKLVLVCVQGSSEVVVPAAVRDFQTDPHFKDRLTTVSFEAADPAESKFLSQMKIDSTLTGTTTVLLAPPGVLVGKFDESASKDDIAAALAKAGKCCDDPNCKHNHQHAPAPRTATQAPPRTRR